MLIQFLKDERGATAIEYGLIAALISIAMVMAFVSLGLDLADIFNTVTAAMRGG
jgi:pilus assembly protein Flp/PilA